MAVFMLIPARRNSVRPQLVVCLILTLEILVYILSTSVQIVNGRPHQTLSNNYSHHPPDDPFTILATTSPTSEMIDQRSDLKEELKLRILQDLGFEGIPNHQGLPPISKEEYLRAYTEYMYNVRRRRQAQRGEPNNAKHRRKHAEIFLESIEPLKQELLEADRDHDVPVNDTARAQRILFAFQLNPQQVGEKEDLRVKQARLWVPEECRLPGSQTSQILEGPMVGMDFTQNLTRWFRQQSPHELLISLNCWNSGIKNVRLEVLWMKLEKKRRIRRQAKHWRRKFNLSDFLEGKSEVKDRKLGRRHSRNCEEVKHGKSCCKKTLEVSFKDLGINDTILGPPKFHMNYCEGRCNARRLPYATVHAIFQHIMLKNGQGTKLCCAPTKLGEVDVVLRDPHRPEILKVTVIKNATVEECGCS